MKGALRRQIQLQDPQLYLNMCSTGYRFPAWAECRVSWSCSHCMPIPVSGTTRLLIWNSTAMLSFCTVETMIGSGRREGMIEITLNAGHSSSGLHQPYAPPENRLLKQFSYEMAKRCWDIEPRTTLGNRNAENSVGHWELYHFIIGKKKFSRWLWAPTYVHLLSSLLYLAISLSVLQKWETLRSDSETRARYTCLVRKPLVPAMHPSSHESPPRSSTASYELRVQNTDSWTKIKRKLIVLNQH